MREDALYHMMALSMIDNIGPVAARTMISYCGSAEAVMKATKRELMTIPIIDDFRANAVVNSNVYEKVEKQLKYNDSKGIASYTYLDKSYPQRLRHFDQSPIVLYFKGDGELNHGRTVGIVGTRSMTERGAEICKDIVSELKRYGVQIISGLAHGVDAMAHKTALNQDVSTIGVMGHGHDTMYPAAHRAMAQKMEQDGGTLTEFAIKMSDAEKYPLKERFPMRNRIIAMLSDVVIVVESAKKGGSMITAEFANDYNKDVFAVPGRLSDKYAQGCNNLIKINKAHLLESAADVAYIMRWDDMDADKLVQRSLFVELDEDEQSVVDLFQDRDAITIDEMIHQLNVPNSEISTLLINLEFKGVLKALPGKKYILL